MAKIVKANLVKKISTSYAKNNCNNGNKINNDYSPKLIH